MLELECWPPLPTDGPPEVSVYHGWSRSLWWYRKERTHWSQRTCSRRLRVEIPQPAFDFFHSESLLNTNNCNLSLASIVQLFWVWGFIIDHNDLLNKKDLYLLLYKAEPGGWAKECSSFFYHPHHRCVFSIKLGCSLYLPSIILKYQKWLHYPSQVILLLKPWWTGNKALMSLHDCARYLILPDR